MLFKLGEWHALCQSVSHVIHPQNLFKLQEAILDQVAYEVNSGVKVQPEAVFTVDLIMILGHHDA
eukprot:1814096-Rhodomonas_salina.1